MSKGMKPKAGYNYKKYKENYGKIRWSQAPTTKRFEDKREKLRRLWEEGKLTYDLAQEINYYGEQINE